MAPEHGQCLVLVHAECDQAAHRHWLETSQIKGLAVTLEKQDETEDLVARALLLMHTEHVLGWGGSCQVLCLLQCWMHLQD